MGVLSQQCRYLPAGIVAASARELPSGFGLCMLTTDDLPAGDERVREGDAGARVSEKGGPHTPHNGAMAKAIDKWKGFDQG